MRCGGGVPRAQPGAPARAATRCRARDVPRRGPRPDEAPPVVGGAAPPRAARRLAAASQRPGGHLQLVLVECSCRTACTTWRADGDVELRLGAPARSTRVSGRMSSTSATTDARRWARPLRQPLVGLGPHHGDAGHDDRARRHLRARHGSAGSRCLRARPHGRRIVEFAGGREAARFVV